MIHPLELAQCLIQLLLGCITLIADLAQPVVDGCCPAVGLLAHCLEVLHALVQLPGQYACIETQQTELSVMLSSNSSFIQFELVTSVCTVKLATKREEAQAGNNEVNHLFGPSFRLSSRSSRCSFLCASWCTSLLRIDRQHGRSASTPSDGTSGTTDKLGWHDKQQIDAISLAHIL